MNKSGPWKTGICLQYIIYLISITLWATLAFALPDFLDNPVDNFKSYIDNQIEKNKALIQSKGTDVIKLYPQYREHIPLDIEIKYDV